MSGSKSDTSYGSYFNQKSNDNAYVGFMYGTAGSSDYASTHANINKSLLLTNLESWYENNLVTYENYLADTIWCNDKNTDGEGGYGTVSTARYSASNRLYSSKEPTLICQNDNNGGKLSKFTVSDTTNGNGNLTYKVGLLTVDEIAFSGAKIGAYNVTTYLYENTGTEFWWTMTPWGYGGSGAFMWYVRSGQPDNWIVNSRLCLRPAISLVSDTEISGGSGTSEDPYVVK